MGVDDIAHVAGSEPQLFKLLVDDVLTREGLRAKRGTPAAP